MSNHSRVGNSASNQQNTIMLLATAAKLSQQNAALKLRPDRSYFSVLTFVFLE
jgi:hypothetical protein